MTRELSSKPSGSRCLEFADAAPGMRSNSGPYPGKNPGGETFLAPTRGEHSKSWGTDVVGLGSGLNGKRVGPVPKLVWRVKLVAELRAGMADFGAEGPSVRKRTLAYCTQCCG